MEHNLTQSPFAIPKEEEEVLSSDEGFRLLRSCLAGDADFCADHADSSPQAKETWLLHRDLLHALVMPVVELFKRASTLAAAALCTSKSEDLELAFAGEARGAFICLQCFVEEEEDWCRTRGCPACVTTETLSTESHIRLTIAASLLSTSHVLTPRSSNSSSPDTSPASETPSSSGPCLPPLPHILPALREALSADPFWGEGHWEHIYSRATQLSLGIQSLITECVDLESLVLSPRPAPHPRLSRVTTLPAVLTRELQNSGTIGERKGAKVKIGQVARRQRKLEQEEMDMMRRCAMQCWARAAVPSRVRGEILGRGEKRSRSLTCP